MPPEIDLRSDTVTKPSREMREAMASAEVGDDVICHDPTVEELQEYVADLLGKESAIFVPSGSMGNQLAIRSHCQPGDEFLCEAECHIYRYEQGAFAQLSGLVPKLFQGTYGILEPVAFAGAISPDDDHTLRTRLVTLENTHNRGGGTIQPLPYVDEICDWAHENGMQTHLDGARLFNAAVASGIDLKRLARDFDSASVCFSKGLGAPVGSAVVGSKEFVKRVRRNRKLFGGGMRQAGIIAAGALYALKHNIDRLEIDHAHAKQLAEAANATSAFAGSRKPETNIVLVKVDPGFGTPAELVEKLAEHGVGAFPFGAQEVRLVTHMDVTAVQIERACEALLAIGNG